MISEYRLHDLEENSNATPETREWAKGREKYDLHAQWNRYARYLRIGTLLPIVEEITPRSITDHTINIQMYHLRQTSNGIFKR